MRERAAPNTMSTSRSSGARAERLPESAATHRSALFGTGLGGGGAGAAERGGSSMQAALEEDNDRLTDELQAKVTALRFASQSIHDEVSEHNRMLSGMVRGGRARQREQPPAARAPRLSPRPLSHAPAASRPPFLRLIPLCNHAEHRL